MHGSRSKIPSKKYRPYLYDLNFLALLGAPYTYIYDISRLRVKHTFYDIMWKNTVEPGRPSMTTWRMRIACWIPKSNRHDTRNM
jgi:hypothetical protein